MSAKKNKKKGTWATVWLLVAAVLIVAVLLAVFVKCKKSGEPTPTPTPTPGDVVVELDKSGIVFGGGSASSGQLPDPDPDPDLPEGSFTLSVEQLRYMPGETAKREITATAADVTWSVAWADSSSAWAQGKSVTQYVRLTSSGNRASVEFLAPFGERIKIVCSNESGKRECLCDCVKTVKSFSGYLPVVIQEEINPHFYSDRFSFSRVSLVSYPYEPIMEECEYEAYTLDQTLGLDLDRSTYTLTQEFIDSFRAYALTQDVTETMRAKINALNTETSAPMIATDPADDTKVLFGGTPETLFSWTFPLLTDGLETSRGGDTTRMADLFLAWLGEAGNSDVEIIDAKYFFEGSVNDFVYACRQKCQLNAS